MIRIEGLSHSLGGETVLSNIDLTVSDGTILGLVGVNGAGKSTLLRLMSGVYLPDAGTIEYDGAPPSLESTRESIFLLPDDPYFTQSSTVKSIKKMYEALYPSFDADVYKRMISFFSLDENKPIRTFSKGMRRQGYITIALATSPKYLLLDEAFDGLDPLARNSVKNELIRLVDEKDATVIISSHSLRELEDFCDSYAVIDGKTLASSGDISQKVERYCKFMLAFTREVTEEIFSGLPIVSLSRSGKFFKCVFDGDPSEIAPKLDALSPAVVEQMTVDFEEVFISEITRRDRI